MDTVLKTTSLGEIRGRTTDGVTKYLGIQYATLKGRFAVAELVESRSGDVLDATKDGPIPFTLPNGCDLELDHIQQQLPKKELTMSDVDCLNLNIAVPADATPQSKLPVFFFIHGGGFYVGSSAWPQYDLTRITKLSIEKSLPAVMVTINYRLGVAGFLTSKALREAGYKPNNGLRDQRVALEWVHKHIQDFGGDPENITAAGQGAGGASITYHLQSQKPLFKRAMVMSGTFLDINSRPQPYSHEGNYLQAIEDLEESDAELWYATPEEKLKTIVEMPGEELVAKLTAATTYEVAIDDDLVLPLATFRELGNPQSDFLPGKKWCSELMIGDLECDSSIWVSSSQITPKLNVNTTKKFIAAVHEVLALYPEVAQHILTAYDINQDTPDEEAFHAVLRFINDMAYTAPTVTIASGFGDKAFVYFFNERNGWEGPWKGRANHFLDVAYLFQNFLEFMSSRQKTVSITFAEDVLRFCHGEAPWAPIVSDDDVENGFFSQIYGPSEEGTITSYYWKSAFGGKTRRQSTLFDCAETVSLDVLREVLDQILASSWLLFGKWG